MPDGDARRNEMLRQIAEANRRRKYAQDAFSRYHRDGLLPAWVTCGYCAGGMIFFRTQFRQHITCCSCGGQSVAMIEVDRADFSRIVLIRPVTPGPPYREWTKDP